MNSFEKRYYRNPAMLGRDVRPLVARLGEVGPVMRGEVLDDAFRERLMLAVTAVNRCVYCARVHARTAVVHGISAQEVHMLADGFLRECPEAELPALLYAQHWAECNGHVDPQARQRLFEVYGDQQARAIELTIQVIRVANLSGNTLDYWIYRLSFWRRRRHNLANVKPVADQLSIVDETKN